MTTPPVPPGGSPGGSPESSASGAPPPMPTAADTQDPWYQYAQQMFPNTMITPEVIAGLKKNMMTMINTTISEINKRQAETQKYNAKVAKGEE